MSTLAIIAIGVVIAGFAVAILFGKASSTSSTPPTPPRPMPGRAGEYRR